MWNGRRSRGLCLERQREEARARMFDCTNCEWQGDWDQTDSGSCPECGADVEEDYEVEEGDDHQ